MFKKLMSSLRSYAAPAVIAFAGLFVTAEQAQAAQINLEEGTVTVESGDVLDKIIANLADQGVQTTREAFQASNPDLTDVNRIRVNQVLNIPGLEKQTPVMTEAEVAAQLNAAFEVFKDMRGEALMFAGLDPANISPASLFGFAQAVDAPAQDVSDVVPAVETAPAAEAVADVEAPEGEVMMASSIQIWSDEGLAEMTEQEVEEKLSLRFDTVTSDMVTGYMTAVKAALASNMDVTGDDVEEDYDGILKDMKPDSIKALPAFAGLTGQRLEDAVHGFQMGAMDARENDIPCDELTEEFYQNAYEQAMPGLPEATLKLLAEAAFAGYDHGRNQVLECEDCGPDDVVRPQPRPENLVPVPEETYEVPKGGILCDISEDINRSFTGIVEQNHIQDPNKLGEGQVLDLTNVGELDEEADELYEQYCTGTGPILPPVHPNVPSNPGQPVTPVPYVPPVIGGCEVLHSRPFGVDTFRLKSLSAEFYGLCGCSTEVFDHNFSGTTPLWGDVRRECPRDDDNDKPEISTPVEQPGGGCQETGGCGHDDDDTPNGDLEGDGDSDNEGNNPPGPNHPKAHVEADGESDDERHTPPGPNKPSGPNGLDLH